MSVCSFDHIDNSVVYPDLPVPQDNFYLWANHHFISCATLNSPYTPKNIFTEMQDKITHELREIIETLAGAEDKAFQNLYNFYYSFVNDQFNSNIWMEHFTPLLE